MDKDNGFPNNKQLREATLIALEELGGSAKTQDINAKVIELLEIPEDIVKLPHPDGVCTLLDYRLRWARTDLKGIRSIENTKRGIWSLVHIQKNDFN
ncbi:winged helix-turn-helix domain-containing protein [Neobacillus sp. CF12]|uniref:winged helix-turn-helix domain-containing protein n=1 Tax=Neobacillus sp. CF12 TaxID=3055864 RepID=UPI0025A2693C|nr:winged helix-turn-helix domain-containing protein [Neobacillus sp. CF12]MDM5326851.1 winged helix-turn-helix domain-containing protein [Neobacillus sp. CF12]